MIAFAWRASISLARFPVAMRILVAIQPEWPGVLSGCAWQAGAA